MANKKLMTPTEFSIMIVELAKILDMSHIDTIVHYCSEEEVEIEDISKLVNRQLKELIEVEAQDLNFLEKTARLPI